MQNLVQIQSWGTFCEKCYTRGTVLPHGNLEWVEARNEDLARIGMGPWQSADGTPEPGNPLHSVVLCPACRVWLSPDQKER